MACEVDLEEFRSRWKKELNQREVTARNSVPCLNEDGVPTKKKDDVYSEVTDEVPPSLAALPSSDLKPETFVSQLKEEIGDSVLYQPFVIVGRLLEEGRHPCTQQKTPSSCAKRRKWSYFQAENEEILYSEDSKKSKYDVRQKNSLVDCLVADLDEINEIPFFEIDLARELALKIFQFLDYKDLCRCAQVSKSWKNLAEDNWLWYRVYKQLSRKMSLVFMSEHTNWKEFLKEEFEKRNTLLINWKGRLAEMRSLEYLRGGVLCAAACQHSTVVAGFSNGQVKLWNLDNEEECIFKPSDMALVLDESAEEGTIANVITDLCTSDHMTLAAFTHGFVDVWLHEGDLSPVHTFHCGQKINFMLLKELNQESLVVLSYGPFVRLEAIYKNTEDEQPHFITWHKLDVNNKISAVKVIPDSSASQILDCNLVIATNYTVSVHQVHQGPTNLSEIHNTYGSPVSCVEISANNQMAIGLSSSGLFDGYQLKLYDIFSGKLLNSLHGHTWYITCIHQGGTSSPFLMSTGCADRKVRLYDSRHAHPVATFAGHSQKISALQMDDWKIVSGCEDGIISVWDQRMMSRLWEVRSRHPVRLCSYDDRRLIIGNIPENKFAQLDEFDYFADRNDRGTLQVHDFLCDQSHRDHLLDICQSGYDQVHGYDYNIKLTMPYDIIL